MMASVSDYCRDVPKWVPAFYSACCGDPNHPTNEILDRWHEGLRRLGAGNVTAKARREGGGGCDPSTTFSYFLFNLTSY
jgi:hypothetical protein